MGLDQATKRPTKQPTKQPTKRPTKQPTKQLANQPISQEDLKQVFELSSGVNGLCLTGPDERVGDERITKRHKILKMMPCSSNDKTIDENQLWTIDDKSNNQIRSLLYDNRCIAPRRGKLDNGRPIELQNCKEKDS